MRLPSLWSRDRDDPFAALHREVERVFEDFGRGWPSARALIGTAGAGASPNVEIHETDTGLEVSAELPGVDEKDVEVTLSENVLTIKGEKRSEHEEKQNGRVFSERSYGSFQRSFALPFEVDASKVTATFDKGVLKVALPKSPEQEKKTRRIEVKSG
ncbi:heat shock protein Hsp20 [Tepidamorphus gemmatus]|jgi:HSP20 family protein|uniref:Heat shock protein Hsp20 n=1 Tax=Tepidamorphus gemmatus TaxID=747076 RepID=A0A4R3M283_9HYPH|nr:Hsp20/alpha crystallin family protein [Tepidamorphus gemmatus]TCT07220.1 heat shock protein Hsp20 [Tepidamorphus gemmatus]